VVDAVFDFSSPWINVVEHVFHLGLGFHLNISNIQYLVYAAECVFNFSSPWINVAMLDRLGLCSFLICKVHLFEK
jgi:hypothetical protein